MCNGNYGSSPAPIINNCIVAPHPIKPRPLEDSVNSTENILSCERDRHSSEEELAHIERQGPEKRKWAQVCGLNNGETSGSSDDEVKELCARPMPLRFSASPPRHLVQKITRKHSDGGSTTLFVANVGPSISDFASPRKRHRLGCNTDDPFVQSGRCMDFEKMQQVCCIFMHAHSWPNKCLSYKIATVFVTWQISLQVLRYDVTQYSIQYGIPPLVPHRKSFTLQSPFFYKQCHYLHTNTLYSERVSKALACAMATGSPSFLLGTLNAMPVCHTKG